MIAPAVSPRKPQPVQKRYGACYDFAHTCLTPSVHTAPQRGQYQFEK